MASSAPTVTKVDAAPPLLIKKLSEKAKLPTRGSAFAAGYDIYASKDTVVPARGKVLVDTDISMAVPDGTCLSPSPFYPPLTQPTQLICTHMLIESAECRWTYCPPLWSRI
jgi:hypothetical protein